MRLSQPFSQPVTDLSGSHRPRHTTYNTHCGRVYQGAAARPGVP